MANHSSTKKSIRKIVKRTAVNTSRKSRIKTYVKKVLAAIASGIYEDARKVMTETQSEIMKGAARNLITKNSASRKVSRLNAKVKAMLSSQEA